jgi:purine-cytosine permease-like protein
MKNRKWLQIMGLAMSLPSIIFVAVWGSMQLAKMNILTQTQAVLLFLAIIGNMLFMMVYYAYKRKN